MLSFIREKFGPIMVGGIIGFIAFVFIVSGVFSPSRTRGLHDGAVAGTVNGEPISISEFNRAVTQRLEFFKALGGGKLTDAQIRNFRVHEGVFTEMVGRKLSLMAAEKAGLGASDEEIREKVRQIPAFQRDGRFDPVAYKTVLEANNHTPASFERLVREDVSLRKWGAYFRARARVSDEEVRREYQVSGDRRNVRYVLLTAETAKKVIEVPKAEIDKFLADPAKENLARAQYDQRKERDLKSVSWEEAKQRIARELLGGERTDEIRKINEKLADQVAAILGKDEASVKKVNAVLKTFGVEARATGLISRQNQYLPGVGEARELMTDAFASPSPIDADSGGKAKKYVSGAWWLVALVIESQKPDLSKFEERKGSLIKQLAYRKEQELQGAVLKKLQEKATVKRNDAVVNPEGEAPARPAKKG